MAAETPDEAVDVATEGVMRLYIDPVDGEEIESSDRLSSRYYESKFPAVEEVVMVTVRRIAEMGAYVQVPFPSLTLNPNPSTLPIRNPSPNPTAPSPPLLQPNSRPPP
uniref:Uncharacterized protein n=1 Tax=Phaeomonas parva TaxID=124430 RepID=A0A7S1XX71_9STRA|mmetsp:Transcript_41735/g.130731  ORF Transcript_41735/g.130731 Transcript_41735/m.130731 type:complete len:108 (+) Transcript_41735:203-526(+)